MDYDTVAGSFHSSFEQLLFFCFYNCRTTLAGDKFGNVFVSRMSTEISDDVENPFSGPNMKPGVGVKKKRYREYLCSIKVHIFIIFTIR